MQAVCVSLSDKMALSRLRDFRLGNESCACSMLWKAAAIGAVGVAAVVCVKRILKKKRKLNVENFQKDKIYLCTFPRPGAGIIQLSPFVLKVETFLRISKLDYEYTITKQPSSKGQWPYVELNGEEIADSWFIIPALQKHFNIQIDKNLDKEKLAVSRMIHTLTDNSLCLTYALYRYSDNIEEFFEVIAPFFMNFAGILFYLLPKSVWRHRIKTAVRAHAYTIGMGRHTPQEVHEIGCKDLQAIADLLGKNKFIFGDEATTADAYLFGHLAQVMYVPMKTNPLRDHVKSSLGNLHQYVERVKSTFFPDWDRLLSAAAQQNYLAKA